MTFPSLWLVCCRKRQLKTIALPPSNNEGGIQNATAAGIGIDTGGYLEERLGEPEGLDKLELRLAEDWKKDGCSLEEIVRELQFL